jgi:hypothetical protein
LKSGQVKKTMAVAKIDYVCGLIPNALRGYNKFFGDLIKLVYNEDYEFKRVLKLIGVQVIGRKTAILVVAIFGRKRFQLKNVLVSAHLHLDVPIILIRTIVFVVCILVESVMLFRFDRYAV